LQNKTQASFQKLSVIKTGIPCPVVAFRVGS
jgi:hypothetical protein